MKLVVQRVKSAALSIDGRPAAHIGPGFFVLAGVTTGDTPEDAAYLADKLAKLRIMEDADGKMNLSLADAGGEALVVSQFTLHANTRRGNRPSFSDAAPPEDAEPLIMLFVSELKKLGVPVRTGVFGAYMAIESHCDGPVTIIIDSSERHIPRRQA